MESKLEIKPGKKIIKKIVRRVVTAAAPVAPVVEELPAVVEDDTYSLPVTPVPAQSAKWTKEEDDKLREFIQNKMGVPDIAKIMNRSENTIRFQMKMVMYGDDRKDNNITNLLDGVKGTQSKPLDISKLYGDTKLVNMMTVFLFLDKMKEGNDYYGKMCEQVKKDCMNQVILAGF
ncbi:MAG: hypothetical protein Hyperionvirus13_28 [Hyperionvirus sp.]|uniref:Myb-like domain-containing protein n=1 Tax=Hyperionvirus sp. TaxID=2487770 RepID=A0A3G5A9H9_9VIRU|nr:MAG: hypothetical protein Hyperionvirus13_28 [Hyperionvirus sp.]